MQAAEKRTCWLQGVRKVKVRCEYRDLKQDRTVVVTETPGQGDELAVVSIRGKETVNIVLDHNVAGLGDRSWGERVGLPSNEGHICRRTVCAIYPLISAVHS